MTKHSYDSKSTTGIYSQALFFTECECVTECFRKEMEIYLLYFYVHLFTFSM